MRTLISALLLTSTGLAAPLSQMSYGELADHSVTRLFEDTYSQLQAVGDTVRPIETKTVRKTIGKTKLMLDIFIFAYPKSDNSDTYEDIRDELDKGYAVIGDYKDLYDSAALIGEAEDSEIAEKRRKVLKWKRGFAAGYPAHRAYLRNTLSRDFQPRKQSDLPKYFWRRVEFRPNSSKTGFQNIKLMTAGVLENARADLQTLLDVKKLDRYEDEELFHDVRKQIRAVLKVASTFDGIYQSDELTAQQYQELDAIVDRFGAINDLLVAHYKEDEQDAKEELLNQANQNWKILRKDLKDMDLRSQLKSIYKAIENSN